MDGIAIRASSVADAPGGWQLAPSSFIWVDTGDPLSPGMDTVVERERVKLGADGSALITGPAPRGRNVRARGEDFPAGQLLIPAGHRLRPADLAAAGHTTLEVTRHGRAHDRGPRLPARCRGGLRVVRRPLLAALQGRQPPDRVWQRVQLACDWTSSPDVEDWVPVTLTPPAGAEAGGAAVATPARRGAGSISRLMRANAWWPIPIGQAKFARGEHIDVLPIAGAPPGYS